MPGVFIASDVFVDAAEAQAKALGVPTARFFVAHPIQDRTDEELVALADQAYAAVLAAVTAQPGSTDMSPERH